MNVVTAGYQSAKGRRLTSKARKKSANDDKRKLLLGFTRHISTTTRRKTLSEDCSRQQHISFTFHIFLQGIRERGVLVFGFHFGGSRSRQTTRLRQRHLSLAFQQEQPTTTLCLTRPSSRNKQQKYATFIQTNLRQ